ncbi:hypothetical protein [Streptomyces sp. NPDC051016]|uniref:hypothetical protein n=1 Tax=Streptomyces sp. NPDC051016 TaxID=3365638 RepID=UPI0037A3B038
MLGGESEVVADEADDGVPDFPQGPVGVPGFRIIRRKVGFGGVGQAEVGAQDVDAGLAQGPGGGVVGEAGQGVHPAQAHGGGGVAELGDGGGEAFGVQAGVLAQGAVFVDALAPVGHHQGDEGAGSGDHAEGQFDQFEEGGGVDAVLRLESPGAEQVPSGVEHRGGHRDGRGEGQGEDGADRPQAQAAPLRPTPGLMFGHIPLRHSPPAAGCGSFLSVPADLARGLDGVGLLLTFG